MKTSAGNALFLTFVMGAVIFFCRAFPFIFFRERQNNGEPKVKRGAAFLDFVEKTVPPAAMTVLAFNSITSPIKTNFTEAIPILTAAAFTALVYLWRRNPLVSIFGGTALYMVLRRIIIR